MEVLEAPKNRSNPSKLPPLKCHKGNRATIKSTGSLTPQFIDRLEDSKKAREKQVCHKKNIYSFSYFL